ncbi:MAG: hypothetical protein JRI70_08885 [Deltaproteobacteria bacterium]|nr:hypothetical protein [Deltaproteobacteria bacterium]
MMHDLKVTGYIGTPSFLVAISKKAGEAGYDLQRDLSIEVGFVAPAGSKHRSRLCSR